MNIDIDEIESSANFAINYMNPLLREFTGTVTPVVVLELIRRLREAEKDSDRVNWLDKKNAEMNARTNSNYGWKFDVNHNRIALTDCNWPNHTARQAIDEAMKIEKENEKTIRSI
jgi:hypothetical protein